jgi:pectate lyase-like protein
VHPPERPSHESGMVVGYRRDRRLLDGDGTFFERPRPRYEGLAAEEVVRVKDLGVKGDGVTDDTASIQLALYESLGRVFIFDAGSYVLRGTVTIPLGSRIVGEAWPRFVAAGPYFSDAR